MKAAVKEAPKCKQHVTDKKDIKNDLMTSDGAGDSTAVTLRLGPGEVGSKAKKRYVRWGFRSFLVVMFNAS